MTKKLLLLSALGLQIGALQNAYGQAFSQNFDSGIPANWIRINDANTPNSTKLGTGLANLMVANGWDVALKSGTDRAAFSISAFTPAAVADRWLISHSFNVTAGQYLTWEDFSVESPADSVEIWVSPTAGTTPAAFTQKIYAGAGPDINVTGTFANGHAISLNSYAGQNIRVAFRQHSYNKRLIGVDNVSVAAISASADGAIAAFPVPVVMGSSSQFKFTLRNAGAANLTSAQVSYKIDNNTPVVQTFSGLNLGYNGTAELTFTTPVGSTPAGAHTVTLTVLQVNGSNDPVAANNTANGNFAVASQTVSRNCLIEEFTSSTCAPCASFNVNFDPLILSQNANVANSKFNVIKYQMNWPNPGNDASYNGDGLTRRSYYGVNSIPHHMTNGLEGGSGNAAEITNCKTPAAYADITGTYIVNAAKDSLFVTVELTPYFTLTNANLKLHVALTEDHYTNNAATTSQKEYYHVMRRMLPNGGGTLINNTTSGVKQTFTFKVPYTVGGVAQMNNNFWGDPAIGNAIVFLQAPDNSILQSGAIRGVHPASVKNVLENASNISISPNPAVDMAILEIELAKAGKVSVSVVDATGRTVNQVAEQKFAAGVQKIQLNTSSLSSGLYNVRIQTEEGIVIEKLTIAK